MRSRGGRNPLGETGCGPAYCRRSFNGVTMQSRLPRESGRSEYTNRSSPGVLTNVTSSSNSRRAISSPATGSSTSTVVCRNRFRSIYVFNGTSARTPPLTPARGVKDVGARRTATQSSPFASWWMPPTLGFVGAWNGAPNFLAEYGRNHSESRSMRVFSSSITSVTDEAVAVDRRTPDIQVIARPSQDASRVQPHLGRRTTRLGNSNARLNGSVGSEDLDSRVPGLRANCGLNRDSARKDHRIRWLNGHTNLIQTGLRLRGQRV